MNGLSINGVSLFIGKIPNRKQECIYFVDGTAMYPFAYIRPEYMPDVERYWEKMLKGIPGHQEWGKMTDEEATELIMKALGYEYMPDDHLWFWSSSTKSSLFGSILTSEEASGKCHDLNVLAGIQSSYPNWDMNYYFTGGKCDYIIANQPTGIYRARKSTIQDAAMFATAEALKGRNKNARD